MICLAWWFSICSSLCCKLASSLSIFASCNSHLCQMLSAALQAVYFVCRCLYQLSALPNDKRRVGLYIAVQRHTGPKVTTTDLATWRSPWQFWQNCTGYRTACLLFQKDWMQLALCIIIPTGPGTAVQFASYLAAGVQDWPCNQGDLAITPTLPQNIVMLLWLLARFLWMWHYGSVCRQAAMCVCSTPFKTALLVKVKPGSQCMTSRPICWLISTHYNARVYYVSMQYLRL